MVFEYGDHEYEVGFTKFISCIRKSRILRRPSSRQPMRRGNFGGFTAICSSDFLFIWTAPERFLLFYTRRHNCFLKLNKSCLSL